MKILLINGPNLNLLGSREPEVYGYTTLKDIESDIRALLSQQGFQLASFQSNHEGELIDFLHENSSSDYAIVNPGAFTHTSIALRDAFASVAIPFIEVHISNVYAREEFRHHSYLSPIASGCIVGCGTAGYRMAAELVVRRLTRK